MPERENEKMLVTSPWQAKHITIFIDTVINSNFKRWGGRMLQVQIMLVIHWCGPKPCFTLVSPSATP